MIAATVALPVSGPEGAYRLSMSANSVEAPAPTVSRPRAAQPAPAATVAATMPPLGSVSLACIMRLLEGRDHRRRCRDGGGSARAAPWPRSCWTRSSPVGGAGWPAGRRIRLGGEQGPELEGGGGQGADAEAELGGDRGPDDRVGEAAGQLGAEQEPEVAEAADHGEEAGGEQELEQAALEPPPEQLADGQRGQDPPGRPRRPRGRGACRCGASRSIRERPPGPTRASAGPGRAAPGLPSGRGGRARWRTGRAGPAARARPRSRAPPPRGRSGCGGAAGCRRRPPRPRPPPGPAARPGPGSGSCSSRPRGASPRPPAGRLPPPPPG